MATPVTRYAKSGDVHIAYQVFGSGPIDLVLIPGFVSHIENYWDHPDFARWFLRLASFARVVMFDKRGTGLSDRVGELPGVGPADGRCSRGHGRGGHRARSAAGIVRRRTDGGPVRRNLSQAMPGARALRRLCALLLLDSDRRGLDALLEYIEQAWGSGGSLATFAPTHLNDPALREWWARDERLGASPAAAIALMRMNSQIDISDILSSVHVPTLVIHIAEDRTVNVEGGRFLAEHIPGARLLELPGDDHLFFIHDDTAGRIADAIEEFLTGSVAAAGGDRVLATVLFTDIVGSTARAEQLGDQRWRNLLDAHHATVRQELARSRGNEVKLLGDGFLATFDGPARAVRCAKAIAEAVRPLGIQVRSGLHTGEIEISEHEVQGIAVHIASRVASLAEPGEVLVSRTVRDLVAGSGLRFDERGRQMLRGLQEPMELYAASN